MRSVREITDPAKQKRQQKVVGVVPNGKEGGGYEEKTHPLQEKQTSLQEKQTPLQSQSSTNTLEPSTPLDNETITQKVIFII